MNAERREASGFEAGFLTGMALMTLLGLLLLSEPCHAEPGNAPDVKGRFVLVVGGSWHYTQPRSTYNTEGTETSLVQLQPFALPQTFTSFKLCVSAGRELQARFGTDGYTLDFACLAVGRV